MGNYLPRLIDSTIQNSLNEVGCVVVEGPTAPTAYTSYR